MTSGIYKITAIHNNEFYIGSSKDIARRWERHRNCLRKNKHQNRFMQRIFDKYQEGCFVFEILEITDELELREQYYMDLLNPSLNLRKIAKNNSGLKHTEEAKQKMRDAHLGKKLSKEHIEKIKKAVVGKPQRKRTEKETLDNAKRQATLTDEQVYQIKWLGWLGLSTNEIARPFNIANTTVFKIIKNYKKAYSHVTFDPSFSPKR
jgi:group I intron endonuclease